jgi:hypothetical protein
MTESNELNESLEGVWWSPACVHWLLALTGFFLGCAGLCDSLVIMFLDCNSVAWKGCRRSSSWTQWLEEQHRG